MKHFIVPELAAFEGDWHFSHVVEARDLMLLSGVTGTRPDGSVDTDPATQFGRAFTHLGQYLGGRTRRGRRSGSASWSRPAHSSNCA